MSTDASATLAWDSPRHPFRGLPVAETAGLRLRPGSPRAVFDHDVWDLRGLADAPAVMSAHRKILDFTTIVNPRWQQVAREYLMARLAPTHPAVATLPHAFRGPLSPHSLSYKLKELTTWFNQLTRLGVVSLAEVEQHHCEAYLAAVSHSAFTPGLRLAPGTIMPMVSAPKRLALYSELLTDRYRPGFVPWEGRSAGEVAGHVRTVENRTPPVPDSLLRPLLANTMYLIDTIAPHLAIEAGNARAAAAHAAQPGGWQLRLGEIDAVREVIADHRRAGTPAPEAPVCATAKRSQLGWGAEDPLLRLAWDAVVFEATRTRGSSGDRETLRPELEQWVADCGIAKPWGRNAAQVPRQDTGELVGWTRPLTRQELNGAIYAVTSACFYLTSALSGMRASELVELTAGCRRQQQRPGGGTRFRLVTRKIKGEEFGGVEDEWVVIDEVQRAIGIAETLTAAAPGQRLFTLECNNSNSRYKALRRWTNGEHGHRLGLHPLPGGLVNPHALRRTLAMTIAQRPHGLMAAKVALKHLSVATTEGYTARPGGHQAGFLAEVTAAEEAEHLRLTIAAYQNYQQGVLPTGAGARDLIAAFTAADQALAQHDPGPVTVIDDRRVERVLKAKAESLHVGVGNYCWFSDPSKALCLKLAGTPDADQPLMGMCDSARCPQATHHTQHRTVWAEHAENIRTVFLGNPRLAKLERARAQTTFDRASRVLAEIDAAAQIHPGRP